MLPNTPAVQSTTPLGNGQTFTSDPFVCYTHNSLIISAKTDQDCTLYVDFSTDATNWDSTLTFFINAGVNEVHRITVTKFYARVRLVNNSGAAQTYLRLQTILGSHDILSNPLNSTTSQDADAVVVKSVPFDTLVAAGLADGRSITNKFGRNPDIDSGTVPEDLWNGGGTYTGFPTGAPEELQVFSSSASDTGTIIFTYLPTTDSTEWLTGSATLNGTTPVNTGITAYRVHTARYESGSSTAFNVGDITIRHRTTTANVFSVMPAGRSQTNTASYTVPKGHTGVIKRFSVRVASNTTGTVTGALWVRSNGSSPRLRRPFSAGNGDHFEETIYGGLVLPEKTDIMIRVLTSSANNLEVSGGYDIEIIKIE